MSKIKIYVKLKKHYILDKNLNTPKNLSNQYKILLEIKSYDILNDKYYGPKIYDFLKCLIRQNVNITHLCNNLKTLKIIVQNRRKYPNYEKDFAYYDTSENKLVFDGYPNLFFLYHELFHIASTYFSEDQTLLFSGFSFFDYNSTEMVRFGRGINEGFTQKLANEYLPNTKYKYFYIDEQEIVYKLEEIVGLKKLKTLYFNADLLGLINELKKYEKKDIIIEFIKDVDYVHDFFGGRIEYNIDVEKKLNKINSFLSNCINQKNNINKYKTKRKQIKK